MKKLRKVSCLVFVGLLILILSFLLLAFFRSRVPSTTVPDKPIQEKPLRVHAQSAVFADSLQKNEK